MEYISEGREILSVGRAVVQEAQGQWFDARFLLATCRGGFLWFSLLIASAKVCDSKAFYVLSKMFSAVCVVCALKKQTKLT